MLTPTMSIERTSLPGRHVVLEPLGRQHRAALAEVIRDGELWAIQETYVPHPDQLDAFFAEADERFAAQDELPFVIVDRTTNAVVGSTRFMHIDREHRSVEIGFTFIARAWQGTQVNRESKYLLLKHAFESWRCIRVQLLADARNERSRRAITRIGAKEEGVLRRHLIRRDGTVRDSVVHNIVAEEWADVKAMLEERIATA